mmetsp:Transcript_24136/g.57488  ORF Transcript_24136/g.57488 Transcript_24136/m.57488 type:complete len:388 (-) Transcript_24136:59-1222(-)
MWTPSLFRPAGGPLHLFYTESRGCWWCESPQCFRRHCKRGAANCHVTVPFGGTSINLAKLTRESARRRALTSMGAKGGSKAAKGSDSISWRPGGDLKVVRLHTSGGALRWQAPETILSEEDGGPVPKVIANPPIVDPATGHWILPYWRESPRGEVVCPTKVEGGDFASALISSDQGKTWRSSGRIAMPNTWRNLTKPDWLIEGSAAPGSDRKTLLQAFRTSREVAYMARSKDGGRTWLPAQPTSLPNPNAKLNILRLSSGALAAAYNNHGSEQVKRRSLLTVSVSYDDGVRWEELAVLETRLEQELRYHYPMLREVGCDLLVTYSVMTPLKAKEPGGIRLVKIPICSGARGAACPCRTSPSSQGPRAWPSPPWAPRPARPSADSEGL